MGPRCWKTEMTRTETRLGLIFFLFYYLVLPYGNAYLQQWLSGDGEVLLAEANVLYYLFLFFVLLAVFRHFLKADLLGLLDCLPENLAAVGLGLLLTIGLRYVLSPLTLPFSDPVPEQYRAELHAAPFPTLVLLLLLIPLLEETLYRGLIYGHLRNISKPMAVAVGTLFYAVSCVWRYALESGDPRDLCLALFALPLALASTLCYEVGGSVWGAAVLHGSVNGLTLLLSAG